MKIATLKTALSDKTGTSILQVNFDLSKYLSNNNATQLYPGIIWNFNTARFSKDFRTSTTQIEKPFTATVFVIINFDPITESEDQKLAKWDLCEGYFGTYINKVNTTDKLQVLDINNLKGQYIPEGILEGRKEIGIMFTDVVIKTWCDA
jgi:hypothetical protein